MSTNQLKKTDKKMMSQTENGRGGREKQREIKQAKKKRMEERNMSDLCEAIFGVKLKP